MYSFKSSNREIFAQTSQPVTVTPNLVEGLTKAALDGLTGTLIGILICLWYIFNKTELSERLQAVETDIRSIKEKEIEDLNNSQIVVKAVLNLEATNKEILIKLNSTDKSLHYIKDRQRTILRIYGALYREKYKLPASADIFDTEVYTDEMDKNSEK